MSLAVFVPSLRFRLPLQAAFTMNGVPRIPALSTRAGFDELLSVISIESSTEGPQTTNPKA